MNNDVTEVRYDIELPYAGVHTEHLMALAALVDCWSARARLRQRWMDRNDPELSPTQRAWRATHQFGG